MSAAPSVLVIEDDEDIRHLLVRHLSRLGYRVSSAATGEAGLEAALADQPDLVLLDLMLPGIDGLEVARRLRSSSVGVPIVVVSIVDQESDRDLGIVGHLAKPFRARDIETMVRGVIGSPLAEGA